MTAKASSVEWQQLEYFRAVGRLQHVSRAAEQLAMTQPALSRAIARLERELGVPLLRRRGRSIELTAYGSAFLRRVERALAEIEAGRAEVADLAGGERGAVTLGFLRSLGARDVPEAVRAFRAAHPGVRFAFIQNNGAALEAQVVAGEIDLCLAAGPPANPRLDWRHVLDQALVLIVPPGHALAGRTKARLPEVRSEPFISFKPGHAIRELTDMVCRAAGFRPAIAFEGDESSSVRGFVGAGFGVALVPQGGVPDDLPTLALDPPVVRQIGLTWVDERDLSQAARAFRDFVVERGDRE